MVMFALAAVAAAEEGLLGRGGRRLVSGSRDGLALENAIALRFEVGNLLIETRENSRQRKS
jgi:hypothetical protein